jgi:hypothetical protein
VAVFALRESNDLGNRGQGLALIDRAGIRWDAAAFAAYLVQMWQEEILEPVI